MGTVAKVLGGGNAVVAGSTGASFYAGKVVGDSKTSIQNELNKIKTNIGDLFKVGPILKDATKKQEESEIVKNITQARKCANYMWPGLVVGDSNSQSTSDITGGCLHIDLKYSQERSVLAHIEMSLSDGKNGIIFGGQIAPARNHPNHIEFFWWRMDVNKESNGKWKIGSGSSVQYNHKFGYIHNNGRFVYNAISFSSNFFKEPTDTVVDLFRICNRTVFTNQKPQILKSCNFSKDSSDLWVQKTKTYKWNMPTNVNGHSPNRHVPEVFDIKLNTHLLSSSLIWGTWRYQTVEGKIKPDKPFNKPDFGNFTHYMNNGTWEACVKGKNDAQCINRTRKQMWGNWYDNTNVVMASKVVYKNESTQEVDLTMLQEF